MQVIGLCRFSYPALGGFQRAHENIEQRKAYLYSKTRLQNRLRLFQCINLPSIVGQTDPDFTYLILTGDDLPEWALERLLELTETLILSRSSNILQDHTARLLQQSFWTKSTQHILIQFNFDWMMMTR